MTIRREDKWFVSVILAIVFAFPLLTGLRSLSMGRDTNWDLRNYHYYNAYSLLEGRTDRHVAPAQLQTYINPLLDLPIYMLAEHYQGRVVGFVLGAIHGLNLSLLFCIYLCVATGSRASRVGWGVTIALFAGLGSGFAAELGTTFNDNIVSLPVLLALMIALRIDGGLADPVSENRAMLSMTIAGLLVGAGVGAKLAASSLLIGSIGACAIESRCWRRGKQATLGSFVVGTGVGLAATGGWWAWRMYREFGNPLMPFFNDRFRSAAINSEAYVDARFLPRGIGEYLTWPLVIGIDGSRVAEMSFVDLRFSAAYLCMLLVMVAKVVRGLRLSPVSEGAGLYKEAGTYVQWFASISLVVWMIQSSTYRHALVLEIVSPLCILIAIDRLCTSRWMLRTVAVLVGALILAVSQPLSWGRGEWTESFVSIDRAVADVPMESVIVMLGEAPMAYVVPFFPSSTRFVRVDGNLALSDESGLFLRARTVVAGAKNLFVLFDTQDQNVNLKGGLGRLGFTGDVNECRPVTSNVNDDLRLCSVTGFSRAVQTREREESRIAPATAALIHGKDEEPARGKVVTLTVSPNPLVVCDSSGVESAKVGLKGMDGVLYSIRVGSPSGPLFARMRGEGEEITEKWVRDGTEFFALGPGGEVAASFKVSARVGKCP